MKTMSEYFSQKLKLEHQISELRQETLDSISTELVRKIESYLHMHDYSSLDELKQLTREDESRGSVHAQCYFELMELIRKIWSDADMDSVYVTETDAHEIFSRLDSVGYHAAIGMLGWG